MAVSIRAGRVDSRGAMPKLLVDISSHGFGHLAQMAPVVRRLREEVRDLEVTVRGGLPQVWLERRVARPFTSVATDQNFGLDMRSPFEIDAAASYARYSALHERYRAAIGDLADWIRATGFDAVLSDISYPVLAAARVVGIPSLAFSSLNWLDLFRFYCGGFEGSAAIAADIEEAYGSATVFCRLQPGMPMSSLVTVPVPEIIAEIGIPRCEAIRRRLNRPAQAKIVVFAFGGIVPGLRPRWRESAVGNHIVFAPDEWCTEGPWLPMAASGTSFLDLIASADVVITKAGYGIVAEVAAAEIPALLITRGDWPEEPYLIEWLQAYGQCRCLAGLLEDLQAKDVFDILDDLHLESKPQRPSTGGEIQIAAIMRDLLGERA